MVVSIALDGGDMPKFWIKVKARYLFVSAEAFHGATGLILGSQNSINTSGLLALI